MELPIAALTVLMSAMEDSHGASGGDNDGPILVVDVVEVLALAMLR